MSIILLLTFMYRFSCHENGQLSRQAFLKELVLEGSRFIDFSYGPSIHQYSSIHYRIIVVLVLFLRNASVVLSVNRRLLKCLIQCFIVQQE